MDKKEIARKIAELLNISDDRIEEAFAIFKEKLVESLKVGEALKIESLGYFQLKEQVEKLDETNFITSTDKSLTIVFSPESGKSETDSLFINLELESKSQDESEFNENIFQLGVDKPLITLTNEKPENIETNKYELETSIVSLINNSEKLKDFDLWEHYLKGKESKNVLDELEKNLDDELDSFSDNNETDNLDLTLGDEDFVKMDENEIFNEIIENSDLMTEDELSDKIDKLDSSSINDIFLDDDLEDNTDNNDESKELNSDVLDEIDLEIEDEEFGEINTDANDLAQEYPNEIIIPESSSDEKQDEIKRSDVPVKEAKSFKTPFEKDIKNKQRKKNYTPLFYTILTSLIIIFGAVVITYLIYNKDLLFSNSDNQVTQGNNSQTEGLTEYNSESIYESTSDEIDETADESTENITEQTNNSINDELSNVTTSINEPSKTVAIESEKSQLVSSDEEKEVAENIFFDGYVYNVQVSSWKQKNIAETEASKLINKGFPAFVVKVYIAKFNSDWHRVRIGPYNSLNEAKSAQTKINK